MRQFEVSDTAMQTIQCMLGSLRAGVSADYTTPLISRSYSNDKDRGRSEMATSVYDACHLSAAAPWLREWEDGKRLKHGTFSRRPGYAFDATVGDSLEKLVRKYTAPRSPVRLCPHAVAYADQAVACLYNVHRHGKLRLLDLVDAAVDYFPGKTGLGFPVMSSDKERHLYNVYQMSQEICDSGFNHGWIEQFPAVLGTRGQPRGPYLFAKSRVVFMMSRVLGNIEKCYQEVAQRALRESESFAAWVGQREVDRAITRLFFRGRERPVLSVDFKSFDSSVPRSIIDRVFSIMASWFTGESALLLDFCREVVNRAGLLVPDSYIHGDDRTGGVPSGCAGTNLVDSLVNWWVIHYAAKRLKSSVIAGMCQGDDGVATFQGNVRLEDIVSVVDRDLGMTVSSDKTLMRSDCVHFLQNVHHRDYVIDGLNVGVRPIMHLTNAMWSYERIDGPDWIRPFDTLRWLQQISEAQHHPSFDRLCLWLQEKDGYLGEVLDRVINRDVVWLSRACAAVKKKMEWNSLVFTPMTLLSSPAVRKLAGLRGFQFGS